MKSATVFALLVAISCGIAGCATLNKDECRYADWYTIGFGDGAKGFQASQIDKHRHACAEYGVKPDIHAYNKGRNSGLLEYCRPGTGYKTGFSGSSYYNVCPAHLEPDFLAAYDYGKKIYSLNSRRSNIQNKLRAGHTRLKDIHLKIEAREALLISDNSSKQQRIKLLDAIKLLTEEKGALESSIIDLESREHKIDHQIKRMVNNSPY